MFCSVQVNPNGRNGLFYGDATSFAIHILALMITVPYVLGMTYLCCIATNHFVQLRVSNIVEEVGMDISCHGESVHDNSKLFGQAHILPLVKVPSMSKLYPASDSEKYPGLRNVLSKTHFKIQEESVEFATVSSLKSYGSNNSLPRPKENTESSDYLQNSDSDSASEDGGFDVDSSVPNRRSPVIISFGTSSPNSTLSWNNLPTENDDIVRLS